MNTHKICFYGELTKIIFQLSSNTHFIRSTVLSLPFFWSVVTSVPVSGWSADKSPVVCRRSRSNQNTGPSWSVCSLWERPSSVGFSSSARLPGTGWWGWFLYSSWLETGFCTSEIDGRVPQSFYKNLFTHLCPVDSPILANILNAIRNTSFMFVFSIFSLYVLWMSECIVHLERWQRAWGGRLVIE